MSGISLKDIIEHREEIEEVLKTLSDDELAKMKTETRLLREEVQKISQMRGKS